MDSHNLRFSSCDLLILLLLVTLLLGPVCSSAPTLTECNFPAIFNFGDSNSDTGALSAAFGQAPPPNGETYFHSPAGRFSDGRLVVDFIGNTPNISPKLYYKFLI
ncbi:unnamed protein product [Coffea canephora]|uniref:GDSL esterase/lipase n=1 Tax=Coffea canephora TaxID=49390 RepID=A0A068UXX0_COFCA|nr:unnamed protein product [Coffea canephora]